MQISGWMTDGTAMLMGRSLRKLKETGASPNVRRA
jgi:hypothetical protein